MCELFGRVGVTPCWNKLALARTSRIFLPSFYSFQNLCVHANAQWAKKSKTCLKSCADGQLKGPHSLAPLRLVLLFVILQLCPPVPRFIPFATFAPPLPVSAGYCVIPAGRQPTPLPSGTNLARFTFLIKFHLICAAFPRRSVVIIVALLINGLRAGLKCEQLLSQDSRCLLAGCNCCNCCIVAAWDLGQDGSDIWGIRRVLG